MRQLNFQVHLWVGIILSLYMIVIGVTASLIIGSVPAVLIGSLLSSTVPDRYVRPVIAFVILASGLKYVGVGATALGWILCSLLLVAALVWIARNRPWRTAETTAAEPVGVAPTVPLDTDGSEPELIGDEA